MKLPTFIPQEVPSEPFSTFEPELSPLVPLSRAAIKLAISGSFTESMLLKSDAWTAGSKVRAAAVLILLIEREHDFDVVLTQRAAHLKHHAGQISFVGGAIENGESAQEAAFREAYEEIGLTSECIEVLGILPNYHTITGFSVTPFVAVISEADWVQQQLQIDAQEVDHVLTVPLSILLNHDLIRVHQYDWQQQTRQFYSVTYQNYFIWGASMAMLRNLDIMLRS